MTETFEQWVSRSAQVPVPASWRVGQHWYFLLNQDRAQVAQLVLEKPGVDPFYDDQNLNRFFNFVADCWKVSDQAHSDAIQAWNLQNGT